MITRQFITELSTKNQTSEQNIAREYCQHLFLSYLYRNVVAEKLLFKGGTALKIVFKSPRFSEDLDFSAYEISVYEINNLVDGVFDSNWKEHFQNKEDSKDDDASALSIKDAGDNGYDFFINMDNVYLQTEIKGNTKIDHRLLEARFKYGMVLVGISLLDYFEKKESEKSNAEETNDTSMFKKIYQLSKAISPILLPMISSL